MAEKPTWLDALGGFFESCKSYLKKLAKPTKLTFGLVVGYWMYSAQKQSVMFLPFICLFGMMVLIVFAVEQKGFRDTLREYLNKRTPDA